MTGMSNVGYMSCYEVFAMDGLVASKAETAKKFNEFFGVDFFSVYVKLPSATHLRICIASIPRTIIIIII